MSGVAVLSFLGFGAAARADELSRFRPEVERHVVHDGRGETADRSFKQIERPQLVRMTPVARVPAFDTRPVTVPHESNHTTIPLRSDVRVRLGEGDRDHYVQAASAPAGSASKPASSIVKEQKERLPLKSEVTNRIAMLHDGDGDHRSDEIGRKSADWKAKQAPAKAKAAGVITEVGDIDHRLGDSFVDMAGIVVIPHRLPIQLRFADKAVPHTLAEFKAYNARKFASIKTPVEEPRQGRQTR
jgi:hypothetical protein